MSDVEFDDYNELVRARELLSASGYCEQTFAAFDDAVNARPLNARPLIEFAEVMGRCYQIEFAEELLGRAEDLSRNSPAILARIATTYHRIFRTQKAGDLLQSLRQSDRISATQLGELAVLLEQLGDLNGAFDVISECVERAPGQPEALLVQARVERLRGNLEAAAKQIESIIDQPAPLLRVHVLMERCAIRDKLGDYDGAIESIERAKAIQREQPEVERLIARNHAISASLSAVHSNIDASVLLRWRQQQRTQHRPVIHLLGFPRSGTTLLEQMLAAHPAIVTSPERAIFVDQILPAMLSSHGTPQLTFSALEDIEPADLATLQELYRDCHESVLGEEIGQRALMDKNPNHTSLIAALLRLLPESQFVFAVRDPRDVVVSNFLRHVPINEYSVAFLSWQGTASQYASDMDIWLGIRQVFDAWVEVRYEDVVTDFQEQVRRVLKKCGLPWDDAVLRYQQLSQYREVNSPSRAEVLKPIHNRASGRWQNYQKHLEPILHILEPAMAALGY